MNRKLYVNVILCAGGTFSMVGANNGILSRLQFYYRITSVTQFNLHTNYNYDKQFSIDKVHSPFHLSILEAILSKLQTQIYANKSNLFTICQYLLCHVAFALILYFLYLFY